MSLDNKICPGSCGGVAAFDASINIPQLSPIEVIRPSFNVMNGLLTESLACSIFLPAILTKSLFVTLPIVMTDGRVLSSLIPTFPTLIIPPWIVAPFFIVMLPSATISPEISMDSLIIVSYIVVVLVVF